MRILHILDHSLPIQSGYSYRTRAILREQRALGWETYQVTSPRHSIATTQEDDYDTFHFYRTGHRVKALGKVPVLDQISVITSLEKRLAEIVPRIEPDILHAHSPCLNGVAALRCSRRFKIPLVYEIRAFWEDAAVDHGTAKIDGLRYLLSRAMESFVARRATIVTTICRGLEEDLLRRGIEDTDIRIVPNAVDPDVFIPGVDRDAELVRRYGLSGRCVIGFIGSFYHYEGLSLLLDALPTMVRGDSRIVVLLVGGGPHEDGLKEQARATGIEDRVIFTGRVPQDQVSRYYSLLDVCVFPRIPIRLTQLVTPLKPLEAMAQGKLVVASDVGGHRELVEHQKTGIMFSAGDKDALAAVVLDTLQHPHRSDEIRRAARHFVETERSWRTTVSRYIDVYESALSKSGVGNKTAELHGP